MAPEYAFDGQFSTKSDVFSFGIYCWRSLAGREVEGFIIWTTPITLLEV
jgi:hypothetical protein